MEAALAIRPCDEICCSNSSAERLFHRSKRDLNCMTCWGLLAAQAENGTMICRPDCHVLELVASGDACSSFDCEINVCGVLHWVNVSTLHISTVDSGRIVVHLLRDVDARKRLECVTRRFLEEVAQVSGETVERLLSSPSPHLQLSTREKQVLRLLSESRSTLEIAARLGVSVITVRNHLNHILRKLDVHSRSQAVLRALRERLF